MNDELQRLLSAQNKSGFMAEMENRIKAISSAKVEDAAAHNAEIEALSVILQQGQSLLPRFSYQAYMRTLENAKIKKTVAKPKFSFSKKTAPAPAPVVKEAEPELNDNQTWQYRDAKNEKKEVSTDENRVGLTELENCSVKIIGNPAAACFTNLKDTIVVAPDIDGSVHITNCKNCRFFLKCKQLRIHETHETDFYVIITSGPIIEDCDHVRFAPANTDAGPWDQVKDFKWLKSEQSPHWCVIPEEERKIPEYGEFIIKTG